MKRHHTRTIKVGRQAIGGRSPIVVQSMTNTKTHQVAATNRQIKRLAQAGCEMVRVAVPDQAAVQALPKIIQASLLPVIADIHFDAKLALAAIHAGVAKIRLNPGNMGLPASLQVARLAMEKKVAVRIGVNAGSLPEKAKKKCTTPQALGRLMAKTALRYASLFEQQGLRAMVISVKASDLHATLTAYRVLAEQSDYPLHLGVTEAGGVLAGSIKTAAGLSPLLLDGIGDTLRVSLTGDPVQEIQVANMLLKFTGRRQRGVEIIACPTCGRTQTNLDKLLRQVETALANETRSMTVAVMGCVVNGPGEARDADVGLAGAPDGSFMLFAKGKAVKRVPASQALAALLQAVKSINH